MFTKVIPVCSCCAFDVSRPDGLTNDDSLDTNDRSDEILSNDPALLDGPKRYEMYCEAQMIMWEEGGSIIPLFTDWLDARSESLGGWKGHPVGEGDGYRIAEWGWLKA